MHGLEKSVNDRRTPQGRESFERTQPLEGREQVKGTQRQIETLGRRHALMHRLAANHGIGHGLQQTPTKGAQIERMVATLSARPKVLMERIPRARERRTHAPDPG
jgi:alcohol dehydrogenase class IV